MSESQFTDLAAKIKQIFANADPGQSKAISCKKLKTMLKTLDPAMTEEKLIQFLGQSSTIPYEAFIDYLYACQSIQQFSFLPYVMPEAVGMSSERLAMLDRYYRDTYVSPGSGPPRLAGVVLAVARHGRLAHLSALGDRVLGEEPMTNDTIFRIYSMTKPVTVITLMTLWEEGRFHLDDPIEMYIPAFKDMQVVKDPAAKVDGDTDVEMEPANRPISIRDLCTHSSGLIYGFFGDSAVHSYYKKHGVTESMGVGTLADFCERLGKCPLLYHPGTNWKYSVSISVLGHLIEVLTGLPLDEAMHQRVFAPLGMTDTGFFVPPEKHHRMAASYSKGGGGIGVDGDGSGEEGLVQIEPAGSQSRFAHKPSFFMGGGGLVSTALDFLRFAQMLVNKGDLNGTRILAPNTVSLIASNCLPFKINAIYGRRGLALANLMKVGHTYGGGGFGYRVPDDSDESSGLSHGLGGVVVSDPQAHGLSTGQGMYFWNGARSTNFFVDFQNGIAAVLMTQLAMGSDPLLTMHNSAMFKNLVHASIVD
eukprot:gnl/MRDRNA2_/MRDRNA2_36313_c0_seq1.p1 gnl/MRDRNA2_/MRDRNA2_36313_c0~~gnl/MRDRNA2_/MRDRNA2_36313_c0_seq1.p1  ORF type:complete len:533 (+),score=89.62 gnl/MRDRNA2_/MRDRNA2_36313_c0_seq1:88-1686(+)